MRYLQRALQLAAERGYLAYPEVREQERSVPDWFRRMADPGHRAAFEGRHGVVVPESLREFYACVPLACFLEACYPEVFLSGYAELSEGEELPPLVRWQSGLYLVTGFHNHSGAVSAVALTGEPDPPEVQGWEGDPDHGTEEARPFSEGVLELVERYEQVLDELAEMYRSAVSDPVCLQRTGGVDWILQTPGIASRLGEDG